ncbi:MAG TPA: helix-turn-helix domain-containing protein [Allocoleopsis sp.]
MEHQIQLLSPFQRKLLQKNLQTDLRPEYRRRLEIMLMADEGYSQTQICEALGCSQETARYWITRARDGKAHQWNDNPMGRPKTISDEYLDRLKELVKHSPREYGYPFERWTAHWLGKHLAKELGIEVCDRHISRLLKEMGLSTRSRRDTAATDLPTTKDSGIAIRDLPSSPSVWLPFNPIKTNQ